MRILIVEDSVTMRKVMEMTFAGEDAELLAVESGELALQQGRDFGPDVAFIDASLPGIDGYEVTRAIKGDPQLAGTAVILMASQHRPLDDARASEVGADDHILKPFDTQEAIDRPPSSQARPKHCTTHLRFPSRVQRRLRQRRLRQPRSLSLHTGPRLRRFR